MNFVTNVEDEMVGLAQEPDNDEDLLNAFAEANSSAEPVPQQAPPAQPATKALSVYEEQLLEIEREKLAMLKATQQRTSQATPPEPPRYEFKNIDADAASDVAGYVQHETAKVRAQIEAESRAVREELEARNREAQAAAETSRVQRQSEDFARQIEHGDLFKGKTAIFRQAVASLQKPENTALWQGVTAAMHSGDVGTAEELFRIVLRKEKRPMSTASISTQGGGVSRPAAPQNNNAEVAYKNLLAAEKALYSNPQSLARYNAHQEAHAKYIEALG
jgi:hypothetical protein